MYRTIEDFLTDLENSSKRTLQILEALTDDKLDQSIVEGHSTLGWLGWHITTAIPFFSNLVGIKLEAPDDVNTVPNKAKVIVNAYKSITSDLSTAIRQSFTDDSLIEEVDHFGDMMPRGAILRTMIDHETHHRGQMTVLLRQARLNVPGVMGPTKEDQQK